MFILTFSKSKSKKFGEALRLAVDLGAVTEKETVTLKMDKSELLFAYRRLMPLIAIIHKWAGTSASYNGQKVHPYRFIFELWNTVATCSAEMNKTGSLNHCNHSPTVKGWGCKFVRSMGRDLTGTGNYETGHPFWYNYGYFEKNGDWKIDKNAIWHKLKNEITVRGLDSCPFFDIRKIKNEVFKELPDRIIIDHVTFRAHFDIRYEAGERKIIPVNIRHISDPGESYRQREKKLINGIGRSMFYAINEIDLPESVLKRNQSLSDKLEVLKETDKVVRVFEGGVCKN